MPKYLLLKHYRGGPDPYRPVPPMDQWAPEDVEAHMTFLGEVSKMLQDRGEYVDAQALTPDAYVGALRRARSRPGHRLTARTPRRATWWPAGTWSTSTATSARVELAAYVSSEPGPGGEPLYEWIDVREVMT